MLQKSSHSHVDHFNSQIVLSSHKFWSDVLSYIDLVWYHILIMAVRDAKISVKKRLADAKVGFSSRPNLYNYLQTKEAPENGVTATYNEDLLPTPPGMPVTHFETSQLTLHTQNIEYGRLYISSHSISPQHSVQAHTILELLWSRLACCTGMP
jgi:hypothetical protein